MINVELYINNQLCDIVTPYELGVRFQREILIPSEITTKDVQYSFTIKLPTSSTNNKIFNYANVEEVKNKFNYEYKALLIVDSIKVFDGKFRLTEIDEDTYKGNLYIPAAKTIKEIFGSKKLTENGNWNIPFTDFASSISEYNTRQKTEIQPCIFPFALYGLLPKVSTNPNAVVNGEVVGEYTAKDLWDEYVRLGIEDIPPSINCLKMLKTIFNNNGYTLGGTAFEDSRLTNLFVSYKNEADYVQEWNWGRLCSFNIKGTWESVVNRYDGSRTFERNIERNETDKGTFYTVNLFDCNQVNFTSISDTGTNVITSDNKDKWNDDRYRRKKAFITIPKSGLYKIKVKGSIELDDTYNHSGRNSGWKWEDGVTGNRFTSAGQYKNGSRNNRFGRKRYEIQLVRDFGSGDFETSYKTVVGFYYKPNNPQNNDFSNKSPENYPKYFPKEYKAHLIDASTDEKFLCGLHFGRASNDSDYNPKGYPANYMFIKNGYSWDKSFTQSKKIYSAYNNPDGCWCWGTDNDATIEVDPDTGEEIEGEESIDLAWRDSNRYEAHIDNIPNSYISQSGDYIGNGELYHIVYLEKGEHITLLCVAEANDLRRNTDKTKWDWGCAYMKMNFELDVQPFRTDTSWITINNNGNGYQNMDWNTESNFKKDNIDLIKFLPNDVKTDEWIDNFCKAFNLTLRLNGLRNFDLDVKQTNTLNTTSVIDLENKANTNYRNNTPLGLPSAFEIGFTINDEEEGYRRTGEDGGGKIETGTVDGTILTQTSNFSYCWYKDIRKKIGNETEKNIQLPIISNYEIWENSMNYSEGVQKLYTSYAQRFWYYSGILNDKAGNISIGGKDLKLADVSNTFNKDKILILNYSNKGNTILRTYFTVIASNDTNYTEIECYLTPDEYDRLDGSSLIKWNGDLYYISSIEGYDITEKNKTKLKLIRKMN